MTGRSRSGMPRNRLPPAGPARYPALYSGRASFARRPPGHGLSRSTISRHPSPAGRIEPRPVRLRAAVDTALVRNPDCSPSGADRRSACRLHPTGPCKSRHTVVREGGDTCRAKLDGATDLRVQTTGRPYARIPLRGGFSASVMMQVVLARRSGPTTRLTQAKRSEHGSVRMDTLADNPLSYPFCHG